MSSICAYACCSPPHFRSPVHTTDGSWATFVSKLQLWPPRTLTADVLPNLRPPHARDVTLLVDGSGQRLNCRQHSPETAPDPRVGRVPVRARTLTIG